MSTWNYRNKGFTLIELITVLALSALVVAILLPLLGAQRNGSMFSISQHNLSALARAHSCYEIDWQGRQYTTVDDDLDLTSGNYCTALDQLGCHPPRILGSDPNGAVWGFWLGEWDCIAETSFSQCNNLAYMFPNQFSQKTYHYGTTRYIQFRAFNQYLDGRYYDRVFYAPEDDLVYSTIDASGAFDDPNQFVPNVGAEYQIAPSSYMLSAAAMYHPDVMRAPSRGGFQDPATLVNGFQSPPTSWCRYPELKSRMIEHGWLRNSPSPTHPVLVDEAIRDFVGERMPGDVQTGWFFNHGLTSSPLAMMYDGSVRRISVADAYVDDARVQLQTDGVDGLWSRDTPMGADGYFNQFSHDASPASGTSFHVLTTDGIRCSADSLQPAANLRRLHIALVSYATDWNRSQWDSIPGDYNEYASCQDYIDQVGCISPLKIGEDCDGGMWAYWIPCPDTGGFGSCSNAEVSLPISIQQSLFGSFRFPNNKAIHDYVGGRFYDPTFYAPGDQAYEEASDKFGIDCGFVPEDNSIAFSSYCLSPAAMLNPNAMTPGGFDQPDVYQSPSVDQAKYPSQKTWLMEHNWIESPEPCNPAFSGCVPFFYNASTQSTPYTLFFDGHVRVLTPMESMISDKRVRAGGGEGLWSRDTPFGDSGYYGDVTFEFFTETSYHVFTFEGILGRDTLK